jgi:hypothetical protein
MCSNQGVCDTFSGKCSCYADTFTGEACADAIIAPVELSTLDPVLDIVGAEVLLMRDALTCIVSLALFFCTG